MSNYYDGVRAIKGSAPTAGQFNRLASNLEILNTSRTPYCFLARKSADQSVSTNVTGLSNTVTFNTEIFDTNNMFNAGTITIPSTARLVRVISNVCFSAMSDLNLYLIANMGQFQPVQQFGYNGTVEGIRAMQIDTGWIPYDGASSPLIQINGAFGQSFTITNNESTWLQVEVLL